MRGQHQEGDSDDEWVNDLTLQEIAELKERVANRSVHSIVKDGSLSQLRVCCSVLSLCCCFFPPTKC